MPILLDTHTFIWFINDSPELSSAAASLIGSEVKVLLSIGSLWEIAIKVKLGKLTLPSAFETFIPEQLALNDIELLPIQMDHLTIISKLPLHHRDPFDRLIIAQATAADMSVISIDTAFDAYGITRIW